MFEESSNKIMACFSDDFRRAIDILTTPLGVDDISDQAIITQQTWGLVLLCVCYHYGTQYVVMCEISHTV